jgi:hypothetical protein
MKQSDNCPRCKHSMDHHVSFSTGRPTLCSYGVGLRKPCRCAEFVKARKRKEPKP